MKLYKIIKKVKFFIAVLMVLMVKVDMVKASHITELKDAAIVKGTKQLADDGLTVLLFLEPAIAFVMLGFQFFMMKFGEEDEGRMRKKRIKQIAIATVVIFSISAIGKILISYFSSATVA